MPTPRRNGPSYARQNSTDVVVPPPLLPAAYPAGESGPGSSSTSQYTHPSSQNSSAPSRNQRYNPTTGLPPVLRKNTVRGAVRGTVREKGANPEQGNYVPVRALTRGKTLTRPERFVAPAPLIDPANDRRRSGLVTTTMVDGIATMSSRKAGFWDPWGLFVNGITFYAPGFLLSKCGITDKLKQRAWKEKVALCSIALMMGGMVAFLTIGLTRVLCPVGQVSSPDSLITLGSQPGYVGIQGFNYNISNSVPTNGVNFVTLSKALSGQDLSPLFTRTNPASCSGFTGAFARSDLCTTSKSDSKTVACPLGNPTKAYLTSLGITNTTQQVGYGWSQVALYQNYMVIDGNVLNLNSYMLGNPNPIANDTVDAALRYILTTMSGSGGKDGTRLFYNSAVLISAVPCLKDRYYAGHLDKVTPGCFVSQLFLYFSLIVILAVVLIRFAMAFYFRWFLAARLIQPPRNLRRKVVSPSVLPEGANIDVNNKTGSAPWTLSPNNESRLRQNGVALKGKTYSDKDGMGKANPIGADGMMSMASIGAELFCVCLVTCYSEGEEGIRITLDSIAATTYSDARKLLFIVCDGMVTGDGEKLSTPDICVGLIERDERFGEPQAMSYESVGEGSKRHNQALIYAGHYVNVKGRRTPAIVIVKTGLAEEVTEKKPGNRGKRDSQMILMNFFSRVTYNDRMSPLDYDLFRKTHSLMGVTPDFFEVCLMVDADTKVYPDSLGYMIRCMQNDTMIMGLCGETRIANKRQSWVTMIQVFEYFISHHLSKAFESVFGGVNCLPGCFSLYRLKARKSGDGDWVPVLVQPQVISEYSQSTVVTLHQKNLLLLGEDRFLTTLLLRTFPNRKMIFCPQARCRTVVPHTFSVLLSQRRRWINSTVHNLMELVLVRNLCGTFCFSMQFVIFIDLIGTVVLPVAICLTYSLIINYIFNPPAGFSDAIPLLLLAAVLGLPAVLILITTFKIVYVGWMLIYLIALPIWNFVLPVYAFSKFDDFSWGETRKVAGEAKGDDIHGTSSGRAARVPLRRWEDYERSRLRKIKRDARRQQDFERNFGSQRFFGQDKASSSYEGSDETSVFSDDDRWGYEIGDYAEDGATNYPPPLGLFAVDDTDAGHETLGAHELEAELERGWAEDNLPIAPYASGSSSEGYRSPGSHDYDYKSASSPPLPPVHQFSYGGHSNNNSFVRSHSSLSSSNQHDAPNPFYSQQDNGSRSPLVPPPLLSGHSFTASEDGQSFAAASHIRRRSGGGGEAGGSPSIDRLELDTGFGNPFGSDEGATSPGGHNAHARR